ncbi:MAG: hypothetical protein WCO30_00745, partial [bacterium]
MRKNNLKRGIIPLLIPIIVAFLLGAVATGGVVYYKDKKVSETVVDSKNEDGDYKINNTPKASAEPISSSTPSHKEKSIETKSPVEQAILTANNILNSNGYINGKKEKNSLGTNESISGIVFGNLDYDDSLEALAIHTWCSASCSRGVTAFKLIGENILMTELQGSNVSGAAEEIKSIKITANIAVVIKADAIGSEQTLNYRVSLVSGKLTSTKLTSSINTYFPKNDIQIYGVIDKTLNSPFGSNYFLVRSNNDIYKIFYDNNVTLYSNDCKGSLLMNLKGELNGVDIRQCTPDS